MQKSVLISLVLCFSASIGCEDAKAAIPAEVLAACERIDTRPYSHQMPLDIKKKNGKIVRFNVEIADNGAERNQGMMCRKTITNDYGMLFVFPNNIQRSFWMKNTLVSLDIIYIDKNGKIISIAKNAKPLDETPLYSKGPAVAVLEIKGGLSDQLKLKAGDQFIHSFFGT